MTEHKEVCRKCQEGRNEKEQGWGSTVYRTHNLPPALACQYLFINSYSKTQATWISLNMILLKLFITLAKHLFLQKKKKKSWGTYSPILLNVTNFLAKGWPIYRLLMNSPQPVAFALPNQFLQVVLMLCPRSLFQMHCDTVPFEPSVCGAAWKFTPRKSAFSG